ncbi:MAG: hypothetical protein NXH87_17285 [Rhodobiaceae bacterium]|nr:hypothetical protein [Rhodobiaceae bacterium]
MKPVKFCGVALVGIALVLLGGCTPEAKAGLRSWAFSPTKYEERTWLSLNYDGPSTGYGDEQLDERTFTINSVVSEVTTVEQGKDLALVHAAKLGQARGFTHFIVQETSVRMRCTRNYGNPIVQMTVRYGKDAEVVGLGELKEVDAVIAELMPRVNNPDASKRAKETAYVDNMRRCRTRQVGPSA